MVSVDKTVTNGDQLFFRIQPKEYEEEVEFAFGKKQEEETAAVEMPQAIPETKNNSPVLEVELKEPIQEYKIENIPKNTELAPVAA